MIPLLLALVNFLPATISVISCSSANIYPSSDQTSRISTKHLPTHRYTTLIYTACNIFHGAGIWSHFVLVYDLDIKVDTQLLYGPMVNTELYRIISVKLETLVEKVKYLNLNDSKYIGALCSLANRISTVSPTGMVVDVVAEGSDYGITTSPTRHLCVRYMYELLVTNVRPNN